MTLDLTRIGEQYSVSSLAETAQRVRGRFLRLARARDTLGLRFAVIPGDAVSDVIVSNGLYEKEYLLPLAAIFESNAAHFAAARALDVGANIGNHACFLARFFADVIAFEPGTTAYHLLQGNIGLNRLGNVVAVQKGLGDRHAMVSFRENRDGNLGDSHLVATGEGSEDVEIVRGDDYLGSLPDSRRVAFIKIDVQGYEKEVIAGLRETIARDRPIIQLENPADPAQSPLGLLEPLGFYDFYAYEEAQNRFKSRSLRRLTRILANRVRIVKYDGVAACHDLLAIPRSH